MEGLLPYFIYSILSLACIASIITFLIQRIYSKKKDEDYLFGSHSMARQSIKHGRLTSVKIPSMQIHVAPPISLNEASRRDSSDIGEQTQGRSSLRDSTSSSDGNFVVVVVDYNNEEQSRNQIYHHSNVSADRMLMQNTHLFVVVVVVVVFALDSVMIFALSTRPIYANVKYPKFKIDLSCLVESILFQFLFRGLLASTSTSSEDDTTQNTKWRVWFQIHYKDMDGCLEVAIFRVKAVNGQPESVPTKLSENFFFVVCVLPEESTKVQTRTCSVHESAAFHDTVYLKISKNDFYDRAIRISMYKVNDVKQRMCCGHTMVKLGLLDFDRCETYYFCNELDSLSKVMTKCRGEMHLSLGYDHKKERLAAQVFAARSLPETSGKFSNTVQSEQKFYMKTIVTVGRRRVKVDCGELCNSLSGIFKCSYSFHIPPRWLQSCSIQFLICEVRNGSERRWGHVVVGSCRYAHGTGLEHWNEMTNQQPKIIEMWHVIRHG
ncbi:Synaptotagmin-12 [Trichinella britovi]|uniref:Synaptotagmin-12 n=1 Tax=Trichinella britovi TaxID=45882 RepID=A0A0V1CSP6_TRIBR|nr:Synaptotagmin-12 [Trichinella britovi]